MHGGIGIQGAQAIKVGLHSTHIQKINGYEFQTVVLQRAGVE
jgi:hypothetical protein